MDFIDMFCGIGTIRMGMEQAGHRCVYSIEWDKWKRKIYSIIFGGEPEGADIRRISANQLPRANCWCFGFPCQDISVAGKQLGFQGKRSGLFYEVMRLLSESEERNKPSYLFIENVKNLLSVNNGWDFFNLLYSLDMGGYDAEWQLLNSKDFGVPQNRERVFIIGHLRGRSTRKVFPIKGGNSQALKQLIGGQQGNRVYDIDGVSCTLASQAGGQGAKTGLYLINKNQGKINFRDDFNCLDANYYKGLDAHQMRTGVLDIRLVLTPDRAEKRQNGRRFKEPGEPMFTLTKQDIHGVWIKEATKKGYAEAYDGDSINLAVPGSQTRRGRVGKGIANTLDTSCNQGTLTQGRIRRLTPKECWRLQGINDAITDRVIAAGISDTQMYRGAGDACTKNVIYEIAKRLV